MAVITDAYPVIREFGPGSTTCASGGYRGTGCAVCSTAEVLVRYGLSIPRTSGGYPDMNALGRSMGHRHRTEANVRHGLSLVPGESCPGGYWCAYCAYLELKARGVPVAYGRLTFGQIVAQLDAGHPIVIPGDYARVPIVSAASFDRLHPAHGRVQRSLSVIPFPHMVTAYSTTRIPNEGLVGINLGDPDFGSSDANAVPSHSVWSPEVFQAFWLGLAANGTRGLSVCYCLIAPPRVGVPPKPPSGGVVLHPEWGSVASGRGSYLLPKGTNVRRDPHVAAGNVFRTLTKAATFAAGQTAYGGTNVRLAGQKGSTLWLGTRDGTRWVFKGLATLEGHTTGHEDIR